MQVTKAATVGNARGIHCRPSASIAKAALAYAGKISISCERGSTDASSIMGLLSLGLQRGHRVTIRVQGPEAERVANQFVDLLEAEFEFASSNPGSLAACQ